MDPVCFWLRMSGGVYSSLFACSGHMSNEYNEQRRLFVYKVVVVTETRVMYSLLPILIPPSTSISYRSALVVSVPHGSDFKFVCPALFSHVSLPVRGPGAGTSTLLPPVASALDLRALRSSTVVSGVRSS